MNQNVYGVILFSLIVGTAIFVSEYFISDYQNPPIYSPVNNTKRTTCFNTTAKHQVSNLIEVKLTQAVLNQKTRKLTTNYQLLGDYPENYQFSFGLHFFVKSGEDFRYLATEKMSVFPQNNLAENLNPYAISSYSWLENLSKKDNLYITVDNRPFNSLENIELPIFNQNEAVPVLIQKANN